MRIRRIAGMAFAVLCQMYLTLICCFFVWALIPLFMGWTATIVSSGSMEPKIQTGDVIFAEIMTQDKLRATMTKGNVLLAEDPAKTGSLITHRVVNINADSVITKGDANASNDSTPMPMENIRGIEKFKVPFLAIPVQTIRAGNFLPTGIFLASIMVSQIIVRKYWKLDKERKNTVASTKGRHKSQRSSVTKKVSAVAVLIMGLSFGATVYLPVPSSMASWNTVSTNASNSFTTCSYFVYSNGVYSCGTAPVDKTTATCDNAVYKTNDPSISVTCSLASTSGTTKNYTVTIASTSATPIEWRLSADWSAVVKFQSAKGYGPGVLDTGAILTKTYTFGGNAGTSTNPADSWNHKYISSSKAAETFTVQVVTSS